MLLHKFPEKLTFIFEIWMKKSYHTGPNCWLSSPFHRLNVRCSATWQNYISSAIYVNFCPIGAAQFSHSSSRSFFIQRHLNHSEGSKTESGAAEASSSAGAWWSSCLREFHPILLCFYCPSIILWRVNLRNCWALAESLFNTAGIWKEIGKK